MPLRHPLALLPYLLALSYSIIYGAAPTRLAYTPPPFFYTSVLFFSSLPRLPMYWLQAAFIRGVLLGLVGLIVPFSTATGTTALGPPTPTPDTSDAAPPARSAVDSLDHAPAAFSVNRTLQGAFPGVYVTQTNGNPAGGMSVRMRGPSTILGGTSPLYVLDGIPISNASRELIDLGGGTQNRLVDLALHDVERIEIMKGPAAQAHYGARASNGVVQIVTKQGTSGPPRVAFSTRVQTEAVRNTLDVNRAQNAQGQVLDNFGNPLPEGARRWDWQDFIYDRAYGTEQALSVSGGFGDTRYRASGSHLTNQGIVEGNHFRRINGRLRLDQTLNDWASLTGSATYARSTTQDIPNGGLNQSYGALTGFISGPNTFDPRPNEDGTFPEGGFRLNPLEVIERFDFDQQTNRFIGSAALNLRPTERLTVDYVLGLDTYEQEATAIIPPGVWGGQTWTRDLQQSERNRTYEQQHVSSRLNVRYRTALSPTLQSTTHVGGSLHHETGTTEEEEIQGMPGDRLFSTAADRFETEYDVYSGFVQETLTWKDRLVLTGAGRVAAYPSFDDSGLAFYPSARLAYTLSDDPFWGDTGLNRLFPHFTLRGAVGVAGGPADATPFYRNQFTGVSPERTREIEIGANTHLLSERVAVNATYYRQRTSDLLVNGGLESAPETSIGFSNFLSNAGTLTNRGIELSVQAQIVDRARTSWTSTLNVSRNRNEVSGLPNDMTIFPNALNLSSAINGEALGVFFGSTFRRDAQGNVIDFAGNVLVEDNGVWRLRDPSAPETEGRGIPMPDTPAVIGDPNPDVVASWINEVGIRNFDLRMQWDAAVGHDVFNYSRSLGTWFASGTSTIYEQELEGTVPTGYSQRASIIDEHWVEDGSFLKLREVSAAYTMRPAAARIERVRLRFTARNVLSIDSYTGYDPEINTGGQRTGVRGLDLATVPVPRTFSLGLTAVF